MTFSQPHAARASDPIEELYQAHALTLTRFALLLVGDKVLALKFYLDLGEEEIARTLRVSRGTVSSTASRALTALARLLEEEQ